MSTEIRIVTKQCRDILRCKRCKITQKQEYTRTTRISEFWPAHMATPKITRTVLSEVQTDGKHVQPATCPDCGQYMQRIPVIGRVADVACNARCLNAVGGDCECACGGKNHGDGHAHY